jgi:PAS domain-containing protein
MIKLADINRAVCAVYGLSRDELLLPAEFDSLPRRLDQSRLMSEARHVAMYLGRRLTTRSLRQIGEALRYRDTASVVWALRSIETRLVVLPEAGKKNNVLPEAGKKVPPAAGKQGDELRDRVARVMALLCIAAINRPLPGAASPAMLASTAPQSPEARP